MNFHPEELKVRFEDIKTKLRNSDPDITETVLEDLCWTMFASWISVQIRVRLIVDR